MMIHQTVTAADLRVGDRILAVWGTRFRQAVRVTEVDVSAEGGVVRHSGWSHIPVRPGDDRPVEIIGRAR